MRKIFAVLLLIVIWNSTVPADILAQPERFLGAWTLVEWTNVRDGEIFYPCLLYTSPSPRDGLLSRMPSSA